MATRAEQCKWHIVPEPAQNQPDANPFFTHTLADIWRNNNVIITSQQPRNVVLTQ